MTVFRCEENKKRPGYQAGHQRGKFRIGERSFNWLSGKQSLHSRLHFYPPHVPTADHNSNYIPSRGLSRWVRATKTLIVSFSRDIVISRSKVALKETGTASKVSRNLEGYLERFAARFHATLTSIGPKASRPATPECHSNGCSSVGTTAVPEKEKPRSASSAGRLRHWFRGSARYSGRVPRVEFADDSANWFPRRV